MKISYISRPSFLPETAVELSQDSGKWTMKIERTSVEIGDKCVQRHTIIKKHEISNVAALKYKKLIGTVNVVGLDDGSVGCDGAMNELCLKNGFIEMKLKWWNSPPSSWSGVSEIVELLLSDASLD